MRKRKNCENPKKIGFFQKNSKSIILLCFIVNLSRVSGQGVCGTPNPDQIVQLDYNQNLAADTDQIMLFDLNPGDQLQESISSRSQFETDLPNCRSSYRLNEDKMTFFDNYKINNQQQLKIFSTDKTRHRIMILENQFSDANGTLLFTTFGYYEINSAIDSTSASKIQILQAQQHLYKLRQQNSVLIQLNLEDYVQSPPGTSIVGMRAKVTLNTPATADDTDLKQGPNQVPNNYVGIGEQKWFTIQETLPLVKSRINENGQIEIQVSDYYTMTSVPIINFVFQSHPQGTYDSDILSIYLNQQCGDRDSWIGQCSLHFDYDQDQNIDESFYRLDFNPGRLKTNGDDLLTSAEFKQKYPQCQVSIQPLVMGLTEKQNQISYSETEAYSAIDVQGKPHQPNIFIYPFNVRFKDDEETQLFYKSCKFYLKNSASQFSKIQIQQPAVKQKYITIASGAQSTQFEIDVATEILDTSTKLGSSIFGFDICQSKDSHFSDLSQCDSTVQFSGNNFPINWFTFNGDPTIQVKYDAILKKFIFQISTYSGQVPVINIQLKVHQDDNQEYNSDVISFYIVKDYIPVVDTEYRKFNAGASYIETSFQLLINLNTDYDQNCFTVTRTITSSVNDQYSYNDFSYSDSQILINSLTILNQTITVTNSFQPKISGCGTLEKIDTYMVEMKSNNASPDIVPFTALDTTVVGFNDQQIDFTPILQENGICSTNNFLDCNKVITIIINKLLGDGTSQKIILIQVSKQAIFQKNYVALTQGSQLDISTGILSLPFSLLEYELSLTMAYNVRQTDFTYVTDEVKRYINKKLLKAWIAKSDVNPVITKNSNTAGTSINFLCEDWTSAEDACQKKIVMGEIQAQEMQIQPVLELDTDESIFKGHENKILQIQDLGTNAEMRYKLENPEILGTDSPFCTCSQFSFKFKFWFSYDQNRVFRFTYQTTGFNKDQMATVLNPNGYELVGKSLQGTNFYFGTVALQDLWQHNINFESIILVDSLNQEQKLADTTNLKWSIDENFKLRVEFLHSETGSTIYARLWNQAYTNNFQSVATPIKLSYCDPIPTDIVGQTIEVQMIYGSSESLEMDILTYHGYTQAQRDMYAGCWTVTTTITGDVNQKTGDIIDNENRKISKFERDLKNRTYQIQQVFTKKSSNSIDTDPEQVYFSNTYNLKFTEGQEIIVDFDLLGISEKFVLKIGEPNEIDLSSIANHFGCSGSTKFDDCLMYQFRENRDLDQIHHYYNDQIFATGILDSVDRTNSYKISFLESARGQTTLPFWLVRHEIDVLSPKKYVSSKPIQVHISDCSDQAEVLIVSGAQERSTVFNAPVLNDLNYGMPLEEIQNYFQAYDPLGTCPFKTFEDNSLKFFSPCDNPQPIQVHSTKLNCNGPCLYQHEKVNWVFAYLPLSDPQFEFKTKKLNMLDKESDFSPCFKVINCVFDPPFSLYNHFFLSQIEQIHYFYFSGDASIISILPLDGKQIVTCATLENQEYEYSLKELSMMGGKVINESEHSVYFEPAVNCNDGRLLCAKILLKNTGNPGYVFNFEISYSVFLQTTLLRIDVRAKLGEDIAEYPKFKFEQIGGLKQLHFMNQADIDSRNFEISPFQLMYEGQYVQKANVMFITDNQKMLFNPHAKIVPDTQIVNEDTQAVIFPLRSDFTNMIEEPFQFELYISSKQIENHSLFGNELSIIMLKEWQNMLVCPDEPSLIKYVTPSLKIPDTNTIKTEDSFLHPIDSYWISVYLECKIQYYKVFKDETNEWQGQELQIVKQTNSFFLWVDRSVYFPNSVYIAGGFKTCCSQQKISIKITTCPEIPIELTDNDLKTQNFIQMQNTQKLIIDFETIKGWFIVYGHSQKEMNSCLSFKLKQKNCLDNPTEFDPVQFQDSKFDQGYPLVFERSKNFTEKSYCFELRSKVGYAQQLQLNFEVCSNQSPKPIDVKQNFTIVVNKTVERILPSVWKEFFIFEQANCTKNPKYTLQIAEEFSKTIYMNEETEEIFLNPNSPDLRDFIDGNFINFSLIAKTFGEIQHKVNLKCQVYVPLIDIVVDKEMKEEGKEVNKGAEQFPKDYLKEFEKVKVNTLTFNLTLTSPPKEKADGDQETSQKDDNEKSQKDVEEANKYKILYDIQIKEINLIELVKKVATVSEPDAKNQEMKDRLKILNVKQAFSVYVEKFILKFKFDETELTKEDREELLANSLIFNLTVDYLDVPYVYQTEIQFQDKYKQDSSKQVTTEEKSNNNEVQSPQNNSEQKNDSFLSIENNISQQVSASQQNIINQGNKFSGFDAQKNEMKKLEQQKNLKREEEAKRLKLLEKVGFPQVEIKPLSNDMKLKMEFNQDMNIPIDENNKLLGSFTQKFNLQIISAVDGSVSKGLEEKNSQSKRFLARRINKSESNQESTAADLLSFSWYVSQWSQSSLELDLLMDNPEVISSKGGYDLLAIDFNELKIQSNITGEYIDLSNLGKQDCHGKIATFCKPLPPLVADTATVEAMQSSGDVMEGSIQALTGGNLLVTILLGGSLQQLWGLIRAMQFINLLALVNVIYPSNAFLALQITSEIAGLDILNGQKYHQDNFIFKKTEALSPNFEAFGIPDLNFILNSGSIMLILGYIIISSICFFFINKICKIFFRYWIFRQIGLRIYQNNFRNQLSVFLVEGYLELCFCSVLQMIAFKNAKNQEDLLEFFKGFDNLYCSISAIVSIFVVIILPLYILFILTKNFEKLHQKEYRNSFGHFFKGIHVSNYNSSIYQVYFMLKRFAVVLTLAFIKRFAYFQVMIFIVLTMLDLCYVIAVMPFKNQKTNYIEIINQITVLLWSYAQYVLLDYSIDLETRSLIGLFIIFLCAGNMLGMLIDMSVEKIKEVYQSQRKNDKIKKAIKLEQKSYQNRQKITGAIPGNFSQFEYQIGYIEAIDFCQKWKPQRDWLVANKLPFLDLQDELLYQKLIKKYKFEEKRAILFKKYQQKLNKMKEDAIKKKTEIQQLVKQKIQIEEEQKQAREKYVQQIARQQKSLSMFGKDPQKIIQTLRGAQGDLHTIEEDKEEQEIVKPDKYQPKVQDQDEEEEEEKVQNIQIQPKKLKIVRALEKKISKFGEQANNDLKKLQKAQKNKFLEEDSILGQLIQDELQIQKQIKTLKNDNGYQDVVIDFMNDSDAEEFELEDNFKSKFDFISEKSDFQIVIDLEDQRKKLGEIDKKNKIAGNPKIDLFSSDGIVGLSNKEKRYSHVNTLAQCLLALPLLQEYFLQDIYKKMNLAIQCGSYKTISLMFKDAFSVDKCLDDTKQYIIDLDYFKKLYDRQFNQNKNMKNKKKIKKKTDSRDPIKLLKFLVADGLQNFGGKGFQEAFSSLYTNQIMRKMFCNIQRQYIRCNGCQRHTQIKRIKTGIGKLEIDILDFDENCFEDLLVKHFGNMKDRLLKPTDGSITKNCKFCQRSFDKVNQRLNIKIEKLAPVQVFQIDRMIGKKEKYYKKIDFPLEINLEDFIDEEQKVIQKPQDYSYQLYGVAGFTNLNPHGNSKKVLEHFVAYTLRDTQRQQKKQSIFKGIVQGFKDIGKDKEKMQWIEFDDEMYRPVSQEQVLQFASQKAYLLFYQQKS